MTAPAPALEESHDAGRVRRAMAAWKRRSRLVHFYRKALPALIGLILVALFGWITWRSLVAAGGDLGRDGAEVRLTNPRFYGLDGRGRTFVLGAREAARPIGAGSERIRLVAPLLRIEDASGDPVEITATRGVYNEREAVVRLAGDVKVREPESGFVFTTQEATVFTRRNLISGTKPINGVGPLGRIDASSYAIINEGERIVFRGDGTLEGRVKTRLEQRRR